MGPLQGCLGLPGQMKFFLGTHEPQWLCRPEMIGVPLFVSRRRLKRILPKRPAVTDWALDSGGFTELRMYGRWTVSPAEYIDDVRRFSERLGRMQFASPCDLMCEPVMLKKTGLTVERHQQLTVQNYCELRARAPDLPFIPVLQGWTVGDYVACVEMYGAAGVNLWAPNAAGGLVGVGTVCRRQGMAEGEEIMRTLSEGGLSLHGFGFKTEGLRACADALSSADSLAWSLNARWNPPLPGCSHKSCANCLKRALWWRNKLLGGVLPERTSSVKRPLKDFRCLGSLRG